jgi:hypothetical protein
MAKKQQSDGVNRSAAIRDLLKEKPDIRAGEAIFDLEAKGITISDHLFYKVKGMLAGRKKRRRKAHRKAMGVVVAAGAAAGVANAPVVKSDALATIRKVKAVALEVGGLRTLKGIVDVLSE